MASALENELERLTRDFVAQILRTIRNASVADVAGVGGAPGAAPKARKTREPREAPARSRRTSSAKDALADRVLGVLSQASAPMGARAIASELGVPADQVAAPLKALRDAGRVRKLGDKRATTYAAA